MNKDDPIARATTTSEELSYEVKHRGPPTELGLSVHWRDRAGNTHLRGHDARVVGATPQDVEDYAEQHLTICGDCKYFDLETGRIEMARQRFAERLVQDEGWKLKHLAAPPDAMGLCGASGGELATSFAAKGCDQFRPKGRR